MIFITFSTENIVCPDPQGHQLIYLNTEFITRPSGSQQKILSVEKHKGVDSESRKGYELIRLKFLTYN